MLILDWDDTLLCSSFLAHHSYQLSSPLYDLTRPLCESDDAATRASREVSLQLRALEACVCTLLHSASAAGQRIAVVTNAEQGWVELSCAKFLPSVLPLLTSLNVRVISARSTFEKAFPNSPLHWKYYAMHDVLTPTFGVDGQPHVCKTVLSLGDSHVERQAVRALGQGVPNTRVKSVKFAERPTAEQLRRQLELVCQCWGYISSHPAELDLQLTVSINPPPMTAADPAAATDVQNAAHAAESKPIVPPLDVHAAADPATIAADVPRPVTPLESPALFDGPDAKDLTPTSAASTKAKQLADAQMQVEAAPVVSIEA